MINLEINDQKISIAAGSTIIEAADQAGVYIPRFCYHRKLSIAANCRMCLVEIEGGRKPLPACATQVTEGMKVYTQSAGALKAQRDVMEFLLINHPLDCPVCDQGGECELQDQSMGYGHAESDYDLSKRAVESDDIGPLVETFMTRCIHCTRCIRFGEEVAGLRELGMTQRGGHSKVGTYVKHFLRSELSGNIIDLCPVGALTSKPFKYQARSWELKEAPSIAPHDCLGSNIFLHSAANVETPNCEVLRVVPRENEGINENWLSDRDRFSYLGLYHPDRVLHPLAKHHNKWEEVSWENALLEVVDRATAIIQTQGAEQLAGIAGASSTIEEFYLLQKLLRALGSNNVDYRLREMDFSDQHAVANFACMQGKLADLENKTAILLVGSYARHEQPLLNHRLNKAVQDGGEVMVVSAIDEAFNYPLAEKMIVSMNAIESTLAGIAAAVGVVGVSARASKEATRIAENLVNGEQSAIVLGPLVMNHPRAAQLRALAEKIADKVSAQFVPLSEGANAQGAWFAGCVPHRGPKGEALAAEGLNAKTVLTEKGVRAYFILGTELEHDCAYSEKALKTLKNAGLVVVLSTFKTPLMEAYADFILPITPFSENDGSFMNIEGELQSFKAVGVPHGESKPAWKVLRVLGNLFQLNGFDFQEAKHVLAELNHLAVEPAAVSTRTIAPIEKSNDDVMRLGTWPMYLTDGLVRRAGALQEVEAEELAKIKINQVTADRLGLPDGSVILVSQGERSLKMPLEIDERLADNTAYLPSGLAETADFGWSFGSIKLRKRVN